MAGPAIIEPEERAPEQALQQVEAKVEINFEIIRQQAVQDTLVKPEVSQQIDRLSDTTNFGKAISEVNKEEAQKLLLDAGYEKSSVDEITYTVITSFLTTNRALQVEKAGEILVGEISDDGRVEILREIGTTSEDLARAKGTDIVAEDRETLRLMGTAINENIEEGLSEKERKDRLNTRLGDILRSAPHAGFSARAIFSMGKEWEIFGKNVEFPEEELEDVDSAELQTLQALRSAMDEMIGKMREAEENAKSKQMDELEEKLTRLVGAGNAGEVRKKIETQGKETDNTIKEILGREMKAVELLRTGRLKEVIASKRKQAVS
jgi:hypothetical protein